MGQCDKKWITLNVGGTIFMTSRSTLTKSTPSSSPLHRISNNSTNVNWDRDETGAYLIDRDPAYFQPVLNYLRHGRLVIHRDVPDEAVLVEAEYFSLPELAKLVKQRMVQRQRHPHLHQLQAISAASAVIGHHHPQQQQQQQPVQPVQARTQTQAPPQPQQHLLQPTALSNSIKQTATVSPTTVDHMLSTSYHHHSSPTLNMVAQQGSQSSLNSLFSSQDLLTNYVNNILADA